ncbi:transcription factor bHLH162-like protein [Tanacetum coccineum]|uniref:Transcription factor bHLH162-like protein n=1 Tax=Tanacetum coccineum TaxID=301880 RepID=A0ABQ5H0D8_9ASTR
MMQEMTSLPDQLHEAANYIKKLQIKLEKMNEEKNNLMGIKKLEINNNHKIKCSNMMVGQARVPQIEVRETGSSLEAVSINWSRLSSVLVSVCNQFRVIHEEGLMLVNVRSGRDMHKKMELQGLKID